MPFVFQVITQVPQKTAKTTIEVTHKNGSTEKIEQAKLSQMTFEKGDVIRFYRGEFLLGTYEVGEKEKVYFSTEPVQMKSGEQNRMNGIQLKTADAYFARIDEQWHGYIDENQVPHIINLSTKWGDLESHPAYRNGNQVFNQGMELVVPCNFDLDPNMQGKYLRIRQYLIVDLTPFDPNKPNVTISEIQTFLNAHGEPLFGGISYSWHSGTQPTKWLVRTMVYLDANGNPINDPEIQLWSAKGLADEDIYPNNPQNYQYLLAGGFIRPTSLDKVWYEEVNGIRIKHAIWTETSQFGGRQIDENSPYEPCITVDAITSILNQNTVIKKNSRPFAPNPASVISTCRFSSESNADINVTVTNILGQRIAELKVAGKKNEDVEIKIDVSALSSGAYFVKMEQEGRIATEKLMVVK